MVLAFAAAMLAFPDNPMVFAFMCIGIVTRVLIVAYMHEGSCFKVREKECAKEILPVPCWGLRNSWHSFASCGRLEFVITFCSFLWIWLYLWTSGICFFVSSIRLNLILDHLCLELYLLLIVAIGYTLCNLLSSFGSYWIWLFVPCLYFCRELLRIPGPIGVCCSLRPYLSMTRNPNFLR